MNLQAGFKIYLPTGLLPVVVFALYKIIEEITSEYEADGTKNMEHALDDLTHLFKPECSSEYLGRE
jgi:hypothetical protein